MDMPGDGPTDARAVPLNIVEQLKKHPAYAVGSLCLAFAIAGWQAHQTFKYEPAIEWRDHDLTERDRQITQLKDQVRKLESLQTPPTARLSDQPPQAHKA